MTYTPGPWFIYAHPDPDCSCVGISEAVPGDEYSSFAGGHTTCYLNPAANARLIAAAPDLLEAAVALLHEIDQIYDVDNGMPNISGFIMEKVPALQAAITKATES